MPPITEKEKEQLELLWFLLNFSNEATWTTPLRAYARSNKRRREDLKKGIPPFLLDRSPDSIENDDSLSFTKTELDGLKTNPLFFARLMACEKEKRERKETETKGPIASPDDPDTVPIDPRAARIKDSLPHLRRGKQPLAGERTPPRPTIPAKRQRQPQEAAESKLWGTPRRGRVLYRSKREKGKENERPVQKEGDKENENEKPAGILKEKNSDADHDARFAAAQQRLHKALTGGGEETGTAQKGESAVEVGGGGFFVRPSDDILEALGGDEEGMQREHGKGGRGTAQTDG